MIERFFETQDKVRGSNPARPISELEMLVGPSQVQILELALAGVVQW